MADIGKFDPKDADAIPETLVVMLEFVISELLIEGQVENYILIMNVDAFSLGLKSIVSKILSFTSNSYRGRLFASYILGMPTALSWMWETFASAFVSENTLKKMKISKTLKNDEMWTHISKEVIEQQYGGSLRDIAKNYWPPSQQLLTHEDKVSDNPLISKEKYQELFRG